jgi:hypothetical protein
MADPNSPSEDPDSPSSESERAPEATAAEPDQEPEVTAAEGQHEPEASAAEGEQEPEASAADLQSQAEQPTSEVEFVGGPPVAQRRGIFSRRLPVVAGLILAGAILVAAGWFASQLLPEALAGAFGGDSREPRTTHLFTQALARHDPAGMRAQVTSKCVADQNSSLCFGPEFDNQFQTFVKDRTITPTFLRQFKGHLGRFVVYDLYLRLRTTGQQDEIMLTFRLAKDGKIDQILTS